MHQSRGCCFRCSFPAGVIWRAASAYGAGGGRATRHSPASHGPGPVAGAHRRSITGTALTITPGEPASLLSSADLPHSTESTLGAPWEARAGPRSERARAAAHAHPRSAGRTAETALPEA